VLFSRRAAVTMLSAVAAISLAACDTDQIGAAAVVGGERITISELQDEAKAVAELAGGEATGDQSELQQTILNGKIQHRMLSAAGAEVGASVSEAQVDTFIQDQFLAQRPDADLNDLLVEFSLTESGFREAVHDQLLYGEIVGAAGDETAAVALVEGVADELEIEVNPRYGEWAGLGLSAVSGSISEPSDLADAVDVG
jgi:hypothetical protein